MRLAGLWIVIWIWAIPLTSMLMGISSLGPRPAAFSRAAREGLWPYRVWTEERRTKLNSDLRHVKVSGNRVKRYSHGSRAGGAGVAARPISGDM